MDTATNASEYLKDVNVSVLTGKFQKRKIIILIFDTESTETKASVIRKRLRTCLSRK